MGTSSLYLGLLILALAVVVFLIVLSSKGRKIKFTALSVLALAFVLAGLFFGEERLIGYTMIGAGVLFSIIDLIKKNKTKSIASV
jgi:amino acid permease